MARVATHFRDAELREEQLRKRYELPAGLKNFAVNLNLLARQDKLPPVVGATTKSSRCWRSCATASDRTP